MVEEIEEDSVFQCVTEGASNFVAENKC